MRRKTARGTEARTLAVFVIFLAVFNAFLWREILKADPPAVVQESVTAEPVRARFVHVETVFDQPERVGEPARIRIPSISLDAVVGKAALADDGSMDVPKHPRDAVWYELGPRPGEPGSAAIAGHMDWKNAAAAVFANLRQVKAGDRILVQDNRGRDVAFVVREIRNYDAVADATDVFFSDDGKAHLNLITCDGSWDKRTRQYSERLVVFADKETE